MTTKIEWSEETMNSGLTALFEKTGNLQFFWVSPSVYVILFKINGYAHEIRGSAESIVQKSLAIANLPHIPRFPRGCDFRVDRYEGGFVIIDTANPNFSLFFKTRKEATARMHDLNDQVYESMSKWMKNYVALVERGKEGIDFFFVD